MQRLFIPPSPYSQAYTKRYQRQVHDALASQIWLGWTPEPHASTRLHWYIRGLNELTQILHRTPLAIGRHSLDDDDGQ